MRSMTRSRTETRQSLALFLALLIFFSCFSWPTAKAAGGDSFLIRGYDTSAIGSAVLRVIVSGPGSVNSGDVSFSVGGLTIQAESTQETPASSQCYILVVDLSKHYFYNRANQHAQALETMVNQLISAGGDEAKYTFVWAASSISTSANLNAGAARSQIQAHLPTLTGNYKEDEGSTVRLNEAMSKALEMTTNTTLAYSVILISDCADNITDMSGSFLAKSIPVYTVALKLSSADKARTNTEAPSAKAGRSMMQNISNVTGGQYFEFDLQDLGGPNADGAGATIGGIGATMKQRAQNTQTYIIRVAENLLNELRASRNDELGMNYQGSRRATRVMTGVNFAQLPTPKPTATPAPNEPMITISNKAQNDVKELQRLLKEKNYYSGKIDGIYNVAMRDIFRAAYEENHSDKIDYDKWPVSLLKEISSWKIHVTPEPSAVALKTGDSNVFVERLQARLAELGYYHRLTRSKTFDGDMQTAVNRFCTQNSLKAQKNGCSADVYSEIMNAGSGNKYKKPAYVDLTPGETDASDDTYVANLQDRLNKLGYLTADYMPGTLDDTTLQAIRDIVDDNKSWKIENLSVITEDLQRRINGARAKATPAPKQTATPVPDAMALRLNDQGGNKRPYIVRLQEKLNQLGYFHKLGSFTEGVFDDTTFAAVQRFANQTGYSGLDVDNGAISAQMFANIMGSGAQYKKPDWIDLSAGDSDEQGDTYVASLQDALIRADYLGTNYLPGTVDDVTMAAVKDACDVNGWVMENGVITADLQKRFAVMNKKPTPTPAPTQTPAPEAIELKLGQNNNPYINKLQTKLNDLNYFYNLQFTPGVFDQNTLNAVNRCCANLNMPAQTGGCSVAVFEAILRTSIPYVPPTYIDLKMGMQDRGLEKYVENLQRKLIELDYLADRADLGTLDQETFDAVAAVCADNKWALGDTVTVRLQERIFEDALVRPKARTIDLALGDQDENGNTYVTALQAALKDKGYDHRVTMTPGVFDENTLTAVNRFCAQMGLKTQENGCTADVCARILDNTQPYNKPEFIDLSLNDRDGATADDRYVKALQDTLYEKGYLQGFTPGVVDQKTLEAAREAAKDNGQTMKGNVIPAEIQKIFPYMPMKATPTPEPTATPRPDFIDLHLNSEDADEREYVIALQNALNMHGYYHRLTMTTGVFDEDTLAALNNFCRQNRQQEQTDGCPASLCSFVIASNVDYRKPDYWEVRKGDRDPEGDTYILNIQENLKTKGYLTGAYTPGVLDEPTMKAAEAACRENGWQIINDTITKELQGQFSTMGNKATPEPTAAPTAAPEFMDVKVGDRSTYAQTLVAQLINLGYNYRLNLNPDVFDEAALEAVRRYCAQVGQTQDLTDTCSESLCRLIMSSNIVYRKPAYYPMALGFADDGEEPAYAKNLQDKLVSLFALEPGSYNAGRIDDQTMEAVLFLCGEKGWEDKFDGQTISVELQSLINSTAPLATATPTPAPTPVPDAIELRYGQEDKEVNFIERLQVKLANAGFFHRISPSYETGKFDDATLEAVNRYRKQVGMPLMTEKDVLSVTLYQTILATDATYRKPDIVDLRLGDTDQDGDTYVANLQTQLKAKFAYTDDELATIADGQIGQAEISAVNRLAEHNNWGVQVVDNIITEELQRRVVGGNALPTPTPEATATPAPDFIDLNPGDENVYVTNLQSKLMDLGYFHRLQRTEKLGKYDAATQEAVNRFCEAVGMKVPENGGCSAQLCGMIAGSSRAYVKPDFLPLQKGEVEQTGDTYIAALQQTLSALGYLAPGYTPGTVDEETWNAVLAICAQNGWDTPTDDVITEELARKISIAAPAPTATPKPAVIALSYGQRDQDGDTYIQDMQAKLRDLGYFHDGQPEQGVYDDVTAAAALRFKQQKGLINADAEDPALGQTMSEFDIEKLMETTDPNKETVAERFIRFITRPVSILNFRIPMWAIFAIGVVLIFAILILLIMAAHRRKGRASVPDSDSHEPFTAQKGYSTASMEPETESSDNSRSQDGFSYTDSTVNTVNNAASTAYPTSGFDAPQPPVGGSVDEDAPTVNDYSPSSYGSVQVPLQLDITFNGKTETQYFTLTDVLRIGRNSKECEIVLKSDPTVSRTHCELLLKGGQVYVHNLSHSEAGTILNGMRIAAGGGSATGEDEATVNIADFKGDEEEALVQSGDELTLGRHTVRITFVQ